METAIVKTIDNETMLEISHFVAKDRREYLKLAGFKGTALKKKEEELRKMNSQANDAVITEAARRGFTTEVGKVAKSGAFSVRFIPPVLDAKSAKATLEKTQAENAELLRQLAELRAAIAAK